VYILVIFAWDKEYQLYYFKGMLMPIIMKNQILFVHGIFFQPTFNFGIVLNPQIGEMAAIIPVINQAAYGGMILFEEDKTEGGVGELQDYYGKSELTNAILTPSDFSFTKRYVRRSDLITYTFKKVGTIWVGSYSGSATGKGGSRCILTPIEEGFLHYEGLEEFLPNPEL
jgi:hypothetical protein